MRTIPLHIIVPLHQPLHATPEQLEEAYNTAYVPLLQLLEQTPDIYVALHFSGHLLDHLARNHEDFLLRIKKLVLQDRIEVLGGLFYGGFVSMLPEFDVRGQIDMGREFWESFLGQAPTGFFLPELAWVPELPRLMQDSGLHYGFVSHHQVRTDHAWPCTHLCPPSLVTVNRGGNRLAAFVIDADQSEALMHHTPAAWLQKLHAHCTVVMSTPEAPTTSPEAAAPITVWIKPQPHQHIADWLHAFTQALNRGVGQTFDTQLPRTSWERDLRACAATISQDIAPESEAHRGKGEIIREWADFPRTYASIAILHKRMLHASRKLRQAIAFMEDEDLESEWNDVLATCQRLVFSAQSPDPYWLSQHAEFSDPSHRHTAYERIIKAEALIDGLYDDHARPRQRKGTTNLRVESQDDDGDHCKEIIISSPHLAAWIQHTDGPRILSLDDREACCNLIDAKHPLTPEYSTHAGMRTWLLERHTPIAALLAHKAHNLLPSFPAWNLSQHDHHLHYQAHFGELSVEQQVALSETQAELSVHYTVTRVGKNTGTSATSALLWAFEIPLHWALPFERILYNGKAVDARSARNLTQVESIAFLDKNDTGITLQFSPAVTVDYDHQYGVVWSHVALEKRSEGSVQLTTRNNNVTTDPVKKRGKKA